MELYGGYLVLELDNRLAENDNKFGSTCILHWVTLESHVSVWIIDDVWFMWYDYADMIWWICIYVDFGDICEYVCNNDIVHICYNGVGFFWWLNPLSFVAYLNMWNRIDKCYLHDYARCDEFLWLLFIHCSLLYFS